MDERLAALVAYGFLIDAGRDAPLYHSIRKSMYVKNILKSNTLEGYDASRITENPEYRKPGVSLTRDKRFAENWGTVVLVLDQARLTADHKIIPRNYWSNSMTSKPVPKKHEAEEFVPGNITNLDRYLTNIYVTDDTLDHWQSLLDAGHSLESLRGDFQCLLDNPKTEQKTLQVLQEALGQKVTAGRDAPLYHSTTLANAAAILRDNEINTNDSVDQTVSLTRNRSFAEAFRGGGVVFVLDQAKLARKVKLEPYDYWSLSDMDEGDKDTERRRNEAEERINGNLSNLDSFLLQIYLSPKLIKRLHLNSDSWTDHSQALLDVVLSHPKFNAKQREFIKNNPLEAENIPAIPSMHPLRANALVLSILTAGRDAPLYHRSDLAGARQIIDGNCLQASRYSGGVSLTRNRDFAETFKGGGVIFVLNQARLAQRYKFKTMDFFDGYQMNTIHRNQHTVERARNESEEFVKGSIQPLESYLDRIYVSPPFLKTALAQYRDVMVDLAQHPKFDPTQKQFILGAGKIKQMQQKYLPQYTKVPSTHPMRNPQP